MDNFLGRSPQKGNKQTKVLKGAGDKASTCRDKTLCPTLSNKSQGDHLETAQRKATGMIKSVRNIA